MKKLVAVMNKSLDHGVVMNALAHMSIGLGAHLGGEALQLIDYCDRERQAYPSISKMPFIILRASAGKIKTLVNLAKEQELQWSAFTHTMTEGGWETQLERTQQTPGEDLIFYGMLLFGQPEEIDPITRKFSLWRG